jgi:hypothetical protein
VKRAERFLSIGEDALGGTLGRDVGGECHADAAHPGDLADHGRRRLPVDVDHGDRRTLAGEAQRDGTADTAAATSDKGRAGDEAGHPPASQAAVAAATLARAVRRQWPQL